MGAQSHRSLEARLAFMDDSLTRKDAQIEYWTQQHAIASQERSVMQGQVQSLEEENRVLRAALLERTDEAQRVAAENVQLRSALEKSSDSDLLQRALKTVDGENHWLRSQIEERGPRTTSPPVRARRRPY